MSKTIVLKDQHGADVVFHHVETQTGSLVYMNRGETLLDVKKLTLTMNENAKTNRIKFKLSIPTVGDDSKTGLPVVSYTQVASGDISIVKFSSSADRELISALHGSLASDNTIKDLIVDGAFPV